MKKLFISLILAVFLAPTQAQERSPFKNIGFGLFLGWGNFIKVENYKEIIKEAKDLYGKKWKCQMAEHFVETMGALGVTIGDTVDLKLYLFDGGHEVIEVNDVPVTVENLDEIQFETNFCD